MNFSRVWIFALTLVGFGIGAGAAAALDAPHALHHARTTEPHITEPHRAAHHAAGASAAKPVARKSTTAHAGKAHAASSRTGTAHASANHAASKSSSARQQAHMTARGSARASARRTAVTSRRRHRFNERFTASSFAKGDIYADDVTAGEDPVVRQAALDAMGDMNGTAVVIDPSNGRILAMVNQKLALAQGAQPCSTFKVAVALAALNENII